MYLTLIHLDSLVDAPQLLPFHDFQPYTANILVAKIATISCVTRPVVIWMQYLQPSTAATLSCYICNFKLQMLQLHKLLIQKLLAAIFSPISCNLEEKRTTNYLQRLQSKVAETKSCSYCNYQLHYSCTLVAKICSVDLKMMEL